MDKIFKELTAAIETQTATIAVHTEALKADTAARLQIADQAMGKTPAKATPAAKPESAAAKKKRLAAEEKAAKDAEAAETKDEGGEDKGDEKAEVKPRPEIDDDGLYDIVEAALNLDDEDDRKTLRDNIKGALSHLGYTELGDVEDQDDLTKMAWYMDLWADEREFTFDKADQALAKAMKSSKKKKLDV